MAEEEIADNDTKQGNSFNLLNINIQGISNKISAPESLAKDRKANAITVTEHRVEKDNIAFYNIRNFKRASGLGRVNHKHGRVAIYVDNNYETEDIPKISALSREIHCEIIATHLVKLNMVIITTYRSPNGSDDIYREVVEVALNYLFEKYPANLKIIFSGDFNVKFQPTENTQTQLLNNHTNNFGLKATITEPTRIQGTTANCIDNIYISHNLHDLYKTKMIDYSISDHIPQLITITVKKEEKCQPRRIYSKDNVERFQIAISNIQWNVITKPKTSLGKALAARRSKVAYLLFDNNMFLYSKARRCAQFLQAIDS